MTRLNFTRAFVLGLALVAVQGCKSPSREAADKAAQRVVDRQNATAHSATDLTNADRNFVARRNARVVTLRAQHEVIELQPMLISAMADAIPLTEAGRADVNEKLQVLQMRLDEASNSISGLASMPAQEFTDRDQAVTDAMARLEDARAAAWKALDNAPRTDRSS